jgi:hypothetical protein
MVSAVGEQTDFGSVSVVGEQDVLLEMLEKLSIQEFIKLVK